jgi:hypothetical protein
MRTHLVRSKWIKGMRRQDTRFGTRSLTETGRQLWMSLHNWRDNQFFRSEPDEGVVLVSILPVYCLFCADSRGCRISAGDVNVRLHPSFGRDPLVRYCKVSEKVFRNSNVFQDLTTGSGQDYHFF